MDIKRIVNNQRGKRMKAWSPMCGGCELSVNKDGVLVAEYGYPATVIYLKGGGKYQDVADAECVIFPDKCQRNWREVENFFIPFEKVLVCNAEGEQWACAFFSHITEKKQYATADGRICKYCIPFAGNEDRAGTQMKETDIEYE